MSVNPPEIESLSQEAGSEETHPERLVALSKISEELARLVAKNPASPPDLLADLSCSYDAETRQSVATNPNTPTTILFKLGREFPEEILNNPIFALLQLENPNLINQIPAATLASLVKCESVPDYFLERGVQLGDRQLSLALTMNTKLSERVLKKLVRSKDFLTTEAAVLHIKYEEEIDAKEDKIERIWSLYWGDENYRELLKRLKWFEPIYRAIAENLPKNNQLLLDNLVCSGENLAIDPAFEERNNLAKSSDTPGPILAELALDKNVWIRRNVAKNPSTPATLLELLVQDKDIFVRENIAESRNANEKVFKQLYQDRMPSIRQRVAKNPHTPPEILRELALDSDRTIRSNVASNPNTPVSVLGDFYREKSYYFYLARNSNTPAFILTELAKSQDTMVREGTAQNPRTPSFMLERLALDKQDIVRQALAKNPPILERVLHELLSDRSERVLQFSTVRYLADYPDRLSVVLQSYPKECTQNFSFFVLLLHPDVPSHLLADQARSSAWRVRYAIASHAKTPLDILSRLTNDANRIVRSAAQATLRRSQASLNGDCDPVS